MENQNLNSPLGFSFTPFPTVTPTSTKISNLTPTQTPSNTTTPTITKTIQPTHTISSTPTKTSSFEEVSFELFIGPNSSYGPTLSIKNLGKNIVYIYDGSEKWMGLNLKNGEIKNFPLKDFNTGIVRIDSNPDNSFSPKCKCYNINYRLGNKNNLSLVGDQIYFEEVPCGSVLNQTILHNNCSCGYKNCGVEQNINQSVISYNTIEICKPNEKLPKGLLYLSASIDPSLGYPVNFDIYYNSEFPNSPDISFTLDETNSNLINLGNFIDYSIILPDNGPKFVFMVITAPNGGKWNTSIECPQQEFPLVYEYKFIKNTPSTFDLSIEKNLFLGTINPEGGLSDGTSSYTSTFNSTTKTSFNIDFSKMSDKKSLYNDSAIINNLGFTKNENSDNASVNTTIEYKHNLFVGGDFDSYNGTDTKSIVKLDKNGNLNEDFSKNFKFSGEVNSIEVVDDNAIFVGGQIRQQIASCGDSILLLITKFYEYTVNVNTQNFDNSFKILKYDFVNNETVEILSDSFNTEIDAYWADGSHFMVASDIAYRYDETTGQGNLFVSFTNCKNCPAPGVTYYHAPLYNQPQVVILRYDILDSSFTLGNRQVLGGGANNVNRRIGRGLAYKEYIIDPNIPYEGHRLLSTLSIAIGENGEEFEYPSSSNLLVNTFPERYFDNTFVSILNQENPPLQNVLWSNLWYGDLSNRFYLPGVTPPPFVGSGNIPPGTSENDIQNSDLLYTIYNTIIYTAYDNTTNTNQLYEIDATTGQVYLSSTFDAIEYGIFDGLFIYDGDLYVITYNSLSPRVRKISDDGLSIEPGQALGVTNPWSDGDNFYVVGAASNVSCNNKSFRPIPPVTCNNTALMVEQISVLKPFESGFRVLKYDVTTNEAETILQVELYENIEVLDIAHSFSAETSSGKLWISYRDFFGEPFKDFVREYDILNELYTISTSYRTIAIDLTNLSPVSTSKRIGKSLSVFDDTRLIMSLSYLIGDKNQEVKWVLLDISTPGDIWGAYVFVTSIAMPTPPVPFNVVQSDVLILPFQLESEVTSGNQFMIFVQTVDLFELEDPNDYNRYLNIFEINTITNTFTLAQSISLESGGPLPGIISTGLFEDGDNIFMTCVDFIAGGPSRLIKINSLDFVIQQTSFIVDGIQDTISVRGASSLKTCNTILVSTPPPPVIEPLCHCVKFFNNTSTSKTITYIDCNDVERKRKFKTGTIKLCIRSISSIPVGVTSEFLGECKNGKCLLTPIDGVAKVNVNGDTDLTFVKNANGGFNGPINIIKKYKNSTIIIGGKFTTYAGFPARGIIVLNYDGTIYNRFNGGFNPSSTEAPNVRGIEILPDYSFIVIGGDDDSGSWLTSFGNVSIPNNVVKINSNGYVDSKFSATTGFDGSAYSITIDSDNKVIIGGEFDCYGDTNGLNCGLENVVRIDSNGICDTNFANSITVDGSIKSIKSIKEFGKICSDYTITSIEYAGNPGVGLNRFMIHITPAISSNVTQVRINTGCGTSIYIPSEAGNFNGLSVGQTVFPANGCTSNAVPAISGSAQTVEFTVIVTCDVGSSISSGVYNFPCTCFNLVNSSPSPQTVTYVSCIAGETQYDTHPQRTKEFIGSTTICAKSIINTGENITYSISNNICANSSATPAINERIKCSPPTINPFFVKNSSTVKQEISGEKNLVFGGSFSGTSNNLAKISLGSETKIFEFVTCDGITGLTYAPINTKIGSIITAYINQTEIICGTIGNEVTSGDTIVFNTDGKFVYSSCSVCSELYHVKILMRENGKNDSIITKSMSKSQIDKVLSDGPIFSTGGPEIYEILDYWLGANKSSSTLNSFFPITPTPTQTPTISLTPQNTPTVTRTPLVTNTPSNTIPNLNPGCPTYFMSNESLYLFNIETSQNYLIESFLDIYKTVKSTATSDKLFTMFNYVIKEGSSYITKIKEYNIFNSPNSVEYSEMYSLETEAEATSIFASDNNNLFVSYKKVTDSGTIDYIVNYVLNEGTIVKSKTQNILSLQKNLRIKDFILTTNNKIITLLLNESNNSYYANQYKNLSYIGQSTCIEFTITSVEYTGPTDEFKINFTPEIDSSIQQIQIRRGEDIFVFYPYSDFNIGDTSIDVKTGLGTVSNWVQTLTFEMSFYCNGIPRTVSATYNFPCDCYTLVNNSISAQTVEFISCISAENENETYPTQSVTFLGTKNICAKSLLSVGPNITYTTNVSICANRSDVPFINEKIKCSPQTNNTFFVKRIEPEILDPKPEVNIFISSAELLQVDSIFEQTSNIYITTKNLSDKESNKMLKQVSFGSSLCDYTITEIEYVGPTNQFIVHISPPIGPDITQIRIGGQNYFPGYDDDYIGLYEGQTAIAHNAMTLNGPPTSAWTQTVDFNVTFYCNGVPNTVQGVYNFPCDCYKLTNTGTTVQTVTYVTCISAYNVYQTYPENTLEFYDTIRICTKEILSLSSDVVATLDGTCANSSGIPFINPDISCRTTLDNLQFISASDTGFKLCEYSIVNIEYVGPTNQFLIHISPPLSSDVTRVRAQVLGGERNYYPGPDNYSISFGQTTLPINIGLAGPVSEWVQTISFDLTFYCDGRPTSISTATFNFPCDCYELTNTTTSAKSITYVTCISAPDAYEGIGFSSYPQETLKFVGTKKICAKRILEIETGITVNLNGTCANSSDEPFVNPNIKCNTNLDNPFFSTKKTLINSDSFDSTQKIVRIETKFPYKISYESKNQTFESLNYFSLFDCSNSGFELPPPALTPTPSLTLGYSALTPTFTKTNKPTKTPTPSHSLTPSITPTRMTPTPTTTKTPTKSVTPTRTQTNTVTSTITATPFKTPKPTSTPFPTLSVTKTVTKTSSVTPTKTPTNSKTPTLTTTPTNTTTKTNTSSLTPTKSVTPSNTLTSSVTKTPFNTPNPTNTITPSVTKTNTLTPSVSTTKTVTPTVTKTKTPTPSMTETIIATPTPSSTSNLQLNFEACCRSLESFIFSIYQIPDHVYSILSANTVWNIYSSGFIGCAKVVTYGSPTESYLFNGVEGPIQSCNVGPCVADCPPNTPTPTKSNTPTITPTKTITPSNTPTKSNTPSKTPTKTVTKSNTPTVTKTSTVTKTLTVSKTPTNTPTKSKTPTNTQTSTATSTTTPTTTPTNTKTPTKTTTPNNTSNPTPTKTKTPTPTPTIGSNIIFIGLFGKTDNIKTIVSENYTNQYYALTSGGTDVYDSTFTNIDTISSINTPSEVTSITSSLFDFNNSKLYFGNLDSTRIDVYDLVSSGASQINVAPDEGFALTFDSTNNLLGVLNGGQSPSTRVTIIDTIFDSINGVITGLTAGYKGSITSDNNGYMYTVGDGARIQIIDAVNLITAGTITTTTNFGLLSKILYNPNNGYLYALNSGGALEYTTTATTQGVISISGYSGINTTMAYDTVKDRIYIGNISNTGVFGVITVDCSTNTILSFTNNLRTGLSTIIDESAKLYYDTLTNELLVVDVDSNDVYRFTT